MPDTTKKTTALDVLEKIAEDAPPKDTSLEEAIARIEKVSSAARSNWFWFFGILGYGAITIMGVSDADFFSTAKALNLPVLNFSVNLRSFLIFAPILVTIVYAYLHGLIEQLWHDLSTIPTRDPSDKANRAIMSRLPVWLLIEAALIVRHICRRRHEESGVEYTVLGAIGTLAVCGLIWLGAPLLITWFWWRSAVAHDLTLSIVQGVCLWGCFAVGWFSLSSLVRTMWWKAPVT